MLVTIRLFAQLRERAGVSELRRDLPEQATVRTAWEALAGELPSLAEHEGSISAAVNDDYARFTTRLQDGDEVAFLPPVSGGQGRLVRVTPAVPVDTRDGRRAARALGFGLWAANEPRLTHV